MNCPYDETSMDCTESRQGAVFRKRTYLCSACARTFQTREYFEFDIAALAPGRRVLSAFDRGIREKILEQRRVREAQDAD